ncbi:hypothetical protein QZH41_013582 [Actinostola sp. cb2023]|nr:hypothetical protein QZH41_013582 [Actinostola sp. cb2023]
MSYLRTEKALKLKELAKSKENSISDLVSKALSDNSIDEKEFGHIMDELQKYETLKSNIRKRNNEILKNEVLDVQKLREELKREIVEQLISPKEITLSFDRTPYGYIYKLRYDNTIR